MIRELATGDRNLVIGLGIVVSRVGDFSWGWPEGSFFNSYYTEV